MQEDKKPSKSRRPYNRQSPSPARPRTWPSPRTVREVTELFEALAPIAPHPDGPYTFEDQKKDFWDVLASEQGRRVLSQIAAMCEGPPIGPPRPDDVNRAATHEFRAGMKWAMYGITRAMAGRVVVEKEEEQPND